AGRSELGRLRHAAGGGRGGGRPRAAARPDRPGARVARRRGGGSLSASLARLAEVVQEATGIRIEERQHPALLAALRRARPDADPASFLRLIQDPVAGESALAQFVDEVTVKETFFLRDRWQLDSIEWRALCRTG